MFYKSMTKDITDYGKKKLYFEMSILSLAIAILGPIRSLQLGQVKKAQAEIDVLVCISTIRARPGHSRAKNRKNKSPVHLRLCPFQAPRYV